MWGGVEGRWVDGHCLLCFVDVVFFGEEYVVNEIEETS